MTFASHCLIASSPWSSPALRDHLLFRILYAVRSGPGAPDIRTRLAAATVGLALFAALGTVFSSTPWTDSWFYIGVGMALSATFVEPFFTKPQDAIVNSVAGIGAIASVEINPIEGLWFAFLAVLLGVAIAGAVAAVSPGGSGTVKWAAYQLASRIGRAVVVGTVALLLVVLGAAARGEADFEALAAGTAALAFAVAVDWRRVVTRIRGRTEAATAVAAVGPRMVLVAASSRSFREGEAVEVETALGGVAGSVVARLPHSQGLRYQIALAEEWTQIFAHFPNEIVLRSAGPDTEVVGAVGDGTTERAIDFQPFGSLDIGAPVSLQVNDAHLLYQVARLRLVEATWLGARAVTAHATARLVGWPSERGLRGGTHLPKPHELVYRSDGIAGELAPEYYAIGRVKGTRIPIGLRTDSARRGHIAVLGMSGMGKTAVSQRICRELGNANVVVALDTTGEYANRLGVPSWTADDFDGRGFSVYEPQGDPPYMASEFMKKAMSAGAAEYQSGSTPTSRVILMEEAHTFVPEWNFALRNQQDHVALTTRMIMQARKYGITVVMVSQRTAVVSKSALSQCENYIILKTLDGTSLEYLEGLVGPEMRDAIPGLQRYEAICVGPAFNADEPVIVTLSSP